MFGRGKTLNDQAEQQAVDARAAREGAKNRPTPKRKAQEAARRQPLVVTDRKLARGLDKVKRREQQLKARQAMITGDDSGLPPRDKGPVKRYIRDYVDARWSVAELMLPFMVLVLALSFVRTTWALSIVFLLVYGLLVVAVLDLVLMWRRISKRVNAKFGEGKSKGTMLYAVMRAFQMRRSRMPKPLVKRGVYPS